MLGGDCNGSGVQINQPRISAFSDVITLAHTLSAGLLAGGGGFSGVAGATGAADVGSTFDSAAKSTGNRDNSRKATHTAGKRGRPAMENEKET
jgi:hypothetical protein